MGGGGGGEVTVNHELPAKKTPLDPNLPQNKTKKIFLAFISKILPSSTIRYAAAGGGCGCNAATFC